MFKFQRPGSGRDTLLEAMLIESEESTGGGGVFAWATASGANILLKDPAFNDFLRRAKFGLTVGLDSITDTRAVEAIHSHTLGNANFKAAAMVNPEGARSLFHPKMSWFDHKDHLTLLVGSGNLTVGGLVTNWEAYSIQRLSGAYAQDARVALDQLKELIKPYEHPLNSELVRRMAEKNAGREMSIKRLQRPESGTAGNAAVESVLVCVLTKSADRWGQSNFPRHILETFFHAEVDSSSRVLLARVDEQGVVHDPISRPAVTVKSRNYRLELDVPSVPFPKEGRPIGIFARLEDGLYLYTVLMPGDPGQAEAREWLYTGHVGGQLPRKVVSLEEARHHVPAASIWRALLPVA